MAIRLSKVLGRSPESWLQMQANYDLWMAQQIDPHDELVAYKFA
jgi:antitoxin HigA-1